MLKRVGSLLRRVACPPLRRTWIHDRRRSHVRLKGGHATRALAPFGIAISVTVCAASATPPSPAAATKDVRIEQKVDAPLPLRAGFRDEDGRHVRIGDLLARLPDRPAVLALVYYRCPMLCNLVLNGLVKGLKGVPLEAGKDFQVIVVSIDPREEPPLAAAKKATYLREYGRPGTEGGWHFLTGGEAQIRELAAAVGFGFRYIEETDQYAHAGGIMVVTPDGRVSRYLFGIEFPPSDLRLALVDASAGRIGTLADALTLLCYSYDPATGRYTPTVMAMVRIGGVLTLLGLGATVLLLSRRGTPAADAAPLGERTALP
jgi:protein SCO1/2